MGSYYHIKRGDCLSSIAKQCGFSDYQTIYQHPENADFRRQRPNPNIIYPGDVLYIPDRETKDVERPTDQQHSFQLKRPKVLLRLCLKDDLHHPYRNTKYHLKIGFQQYDGSTDGEGLLEQEIPADATSGELTFLPGMGDPAEAYTFALSFGDLDPIEENSGVEARLRNLGFGPAEGSGDGLSDDDRREALKAFQDKFGLEVTGELDDPTRGRLRQLHDAE